MLCDAVQSRIVLKHALENQYAILAINADSHACLFDCLEAARRLDAPVIIETSLWQLKGHSFGAGDAVVGLTRYLANLAVLANRDPFKHIPVIFHTDHIKGPETMHILGEAIRGVTINANDQKMVLRASTVSLDASAFSAEENIRHLLALCQIAADADIPVTLEMESAVDEGITSDDEARFLLGSVEQQFPNHVHLWAPGVGTQHGFHDDMKFEVSTIARHARLAAEITGRPVGIALHGSTGLSQADLTDASKAGVVKVNWSTESLYIRSEAARDYYRDNEKKLNKQHSEWKNTAMDNGVQEYVSRQYVPRVMERMNILGGAGRAAAINKLIHPLQAWAL